MLFVCKYYGFHIQNFKFALYIGPAAQHHLRPAFRFIGFIVIDTFFFFSWKKFRPSEFMCNKSILDDILEYDASCSIQ